MKSDEFNNVKVNNEKSNINAEFTNAQKTEYSFQSENSTTLNDELNNNKTINDDPEANTLKSHEEEERKEKKEVKEQAENLSSSTSTAASTATGVAGTVGSIAATAATAAIVAIGALVGIDLIQDPTENKDLITFLSSEVGLDTIDFSFSMPASLLSYEDSPTGDMGRKEVVALIENSQGFNERYYISEYEHIDDFTLVYFASLSGLQRNTDYALTVQLEEVIYTEQTEEIKYTDLAFRTFTTLSWRQKIQFHPLDVTYNSVNFEFEVALADIGVDPLNPQMPNIFAVIYDRDDYRQSLTLTQYSMIDNEHALVYDSFTGLTPQTYYTIDVFQDDESNLLGSASFMTYERTSSVVFEEVNAARRDVSFTFTVDKADIDYDPTAPSPAAVQFAILSDDGTYSDQAWAQSFEEVDDNTVRSSGSFRQITPNLSYTLTISLSTETGLVELGKTDFDTLHEFQFQKYPSSDVTSHSTNTTVSMKASYIGFVSPEATPDVINKLSIEIVKVGSVDQPITYPFNSLSTYAEYAVAASGSLDGLEPNTDYTLSVYFTPDNEERELLGQADFKTSPDPYGFNFHTVTPSENSCYFAFDINPDEITSNQIYVNIVYNGSQLTREQVTQFETSTRDESLKTGSITISGIPADATFEARVLNWDSGIVYGIKTFTTSYSSYGFHVTDISTTKDSLTAQFYVNPQMFTETLQELMNKIYLEYKTPTSGSQTAAPGAFTQTSSDVAESSFSVSNLTAETEYYGTVYYNGDSLIPLGIFSFTTKAIPPQIDGLTSNFEVAQDLNGNYRMPIKIEHHGSTDIYGNSFILNFMAAGATSPIQGYVPVGDGEYDYAVFASDSGIDSYLTSGAQFVLTVTCANDTSTELYSDSNITFTDVSSVSQPNKIYGGKVLTTDLYSASNIDVSVSIVAAIFDSSAEASIVFTTPTGSEYEYVLDISSYNYVSNLTFDVLTTKGSTFAMTYETLKGIFDGVTLSVKILYYGTSGSTDPRELILTDNFMFNFVD